MKTDILIRPAEKIDIESMVQIIADNFDFAMNEHSPAVREHFKQHCSAEALASQLEWKKVFVLLDGGEIVGTGALANFGTAEIPKWSISNFFIRRDRHRQKLGDMLIQYLFGEAEKLSIGTLHVPSTRTGMKFYQKYGFVLDEVQPEEDVKLEITWHTKKLRS